VAERWEGTTREDLRVALLAPEKTLRLPDPGLTVEVEAQGEKLTIILRARALARFVTLALPGADLVFSDNFFDLPARRTMTVHAPLPPGWTPGSVRRALRVRTLADLPRSRAWKERWFRLWGWLAPRALLSRLLHLG